MFVGIRVSTPLETQSETSRALGNAERLDTEESEREAPPNSSNNVTPITSCPDLQEHKEGSRCGDERSHTASENQQKIDEAASDLTSMAFRTQQTQAGDDTLLGILREQLEFVIRNVTSVHSVELPILGVGDILELDELEDLRV